MAIKLNPFQDVEFHGWAPELTKKNHITDLYMAGQEIASDVMIDLHTSRVGNNLEAFLAQFPVKYFDSPSEYTWNVRGASRRNIPLVEARDENGTVVTANSGMVGAFTTHFQLVFDERMFHKGEVIVGNLNEIYPMRIIGDPRNEGTQVVYTVELMGNNQKGIPAKRLLKGELFSKDYAPVERELSNKVGGIDHASPIFMRNEFSTIRIGHKVTGEMMYDKLIIGIPVTDDKGNVRVVNRWMHEVEYQFEDTWAHYKTHLLAYGRSNRDENGEYHNFGESGEVIRMGMGLYEQREVANTLYYVDFDLKLLEDSAYDLSVNKLGFKNRVFVLRTGEKGAALFHKAVGDKTSGWAPAYTDGKAFGIQQTSSELHQNALAAGYQFTEWRGPNGIVFRVEVDSMYDDPYRNKIQHPLGGPASSYRFDILDIGDSREPNIQRVAAKGDPEFRGMEWGMRNPFTGERENNNMSHGEDSATLHRMASMGVLVYDPTRTVAIIPAILQG